MKFFTLFWQNLTLGAEILTQNPILLLSLFAFLGLVVVCLGLSVKIAQVAREVSSFQKQKKELLLQLITQNKESAG